MDFLQNWIDEITFFLQGQDFCSIAIIVGAAVYIVRRVVWHSTDHPLAARLAIVAFGGAFAFCQFYLEKPFLTSVAIGCGSLLVLWLLSPLLKVRERINEALMRQHYRKIEEERAQRERSQLPASPLASVVDEHEVQRKNQEKQRKADARFEAETLYRRHFMAVREAFPPDTFEAYLKKYLNDNDPVEAIKQRLDKFRDFLLELTCRGKPSGVKDRMEASLAEYQEQIGIIEQLTFDEPYKERLRIKARDTLFDKIKEMMGD
jgi:hypothetical protein